MFTAIAAGALVFLVSLWLALMCAFVWVTLEALFAGKHVKCLLWLFVTCNLFFGGIATLCHFYAP